jgi:hypothetical protein
MFTSLKSLTLPAIAAAALSSLNPTPSTAAATVVSAAHYQTALTLTCSGQGCRAEFPAVGNRRRLHLTRITCHMRSAQYAAFALGRIDIRDAGNVSVTAQFLPADYSTDWGHHVINSAVDLHVHAGRQFIVMLALAAGGGDAYDGGCTAHGTMEVLQ